VYEAILHNFDFIDEAKLINIDWNFRVENGLEHTYDGGLWKGSGHDVLD
jgi:hypothetical protein